MVTSKQEALYHIYHEEQMYELGRITESALEDKLEYFIGVLAQHDADEAAKQRKRVNRKYGFSI